MNFTRLLFSIGGNHAYIFFNTAVLVMEQGSLLSHGAIVARELGIPAVTNVGNATKIFKTGQMLHVDANQGIVKIIK